MIPNSVWLFNSCWKKMSVSRYSLSQGWLLYKARLVLASNSSLLPTVLQTFHEFGLGGHSRFLRTYKRLTSELYWGGMKGTSKKYVEECLICQKNKSMTTSPTRLLLPLEIVEHVWGRYLDGAHWYECDRSGWCIKQRSPFYCHEAPVYGQFSGWSFYKRSSEIPWLSSFNSFWAMIKTDQPLLDRIAPIARY